MRKTVRKLRIRHETLYALETSEHRFVRGGAQTPTQDTPTCASCPAAAQAMDGYIRG